MRALTVNLPDNLHEKARELAASKNLSMDALVTIALTQSLSRMVTEPHLEERAARATGKGWMSFWPRFRPQSRRNGSAAGRIPTEALKSKRRRSFLS